MKQNQIKAKFFALYLGQKVQFGRGEKEPFECHPDYISNDWFLQLRTVDQLTDEELVQVARFAHQMPNAKFKVIRDTDIVHVEHTDAYAITSHISLYKNYGSVSCNTHFEKTETDEGATFETNIGKGKNSANLPVPYIAICDYLRALGVLLQFTYLSETNEQITLSPSNLIENGWVVVSKK